MVFQNYALYPHMTVYDNIAFPLRARPDAQGRDRRQGRATAKMLGLEDHCSSASRAQLSGGQRQRVAMGRAIVREPERVPDGRAALQPGREAARRRCAPRSRAAPAQFGVTTLYVTHDQVEAMTIGDRVAVMRKGGVAAGRRPADHLRPTPPTCSSPASSARRPMNLFQAAGRALGGRLSAGRRRAPASGSTSRRRRSTPGWRTGRRTGRRGRAPGAAGRGGHRRSTAGCAARCCCARRSAPTRWPTSPSTAPRR